MLKGIFGLPEMWLVKVRYAVVLPDGFETVLETWGCGETEEAAKKIAASRGKVVEVVVMACPKKGLTEQVAAPIPQINETPARANQ